MAATWTLLKSTPYSACYDVGGEDAAPGVLDYSNPLVLGALVPGPYRTYITKSLGALDHLNLDANTIGDRRKRRVRIYRVGGNAGNGEAIAPGSNFTLAWVANGLTATVAGGEGNPQGMLIEIRFVHSSRR